MWIEPRWPSNKVGLMILPASGGTNRFHLSFIIQDYHLGCITVGVMGLDVFRIGFKCGGPVTGPFSLIHLSCEFFQGTVQDPVSVCCGINNTMSDDGSSTRSGGHFTFLGSIDPDFDNLRRETRDHTETEPPAV